MLFDPKKIKMNKKITTISDPETSFKNNGKFII
jgi:hypothetical protein